MYATVRIKNGLAEAIDKLVKEAKDEIGLPVYRSRADFVTKACKKVLKESLED